MPKLEIPKVDMPKVDAPKIESLKVSAPTVDFKAPEIPDVKLPSFSLPKVDMPKTPSFDMPKIDIPKTPSFDMPKIDMPKTPSFDMPKFDAPAAPSFNVPVKSSAPAESFDTPTESQEARDARAAAKKVEFKEADSVARASNTDLELFFFVMQTFLTLPFPSMHHRRLKRLLSLHVKKQTMPRRRSKRPREKHVQLGLVGNFFVFAVSVLVINVLKGDNDYLVMLIKNS